MALYIIHGSPVYPIVAQWPKLCKWEKQCLTRFACGGYVHKELNSMQALVHLFLSLLPEREVRGRAFEASERTGQSPTNLENAKGVLPRG